MQFAYEYSSQILKKKHVKMPSASTFKKKSKKCSLFMKNECKFKKNDEIKNNEKQKMTV